MAKRLVLSLAALAAGTALLVAAGTAGATGGAAAAAGGTLRINLVTDTDYVDPALAYYVVSWEMEYATCAKLLNYPDKEAPAGSQLGPEVATGLPSVSADGKTYTFTLRTGKSAYRFNTGQVVTPAHFAAAINRTLNPKMQSPGAAFVRDVAGAQAVLEGKAKSASGVIVRGNKLIVRLTDVAPDFLARIAMPFFCAIPTNLPIVPEGVNSLPSAGPYYVASRTPNRSIVLQRNPNYSGPRPRNLSSIVYNVGVSEEATLLQVERAESDYAGDGVAPTAYAQLGAKYGVNKSQFYVKPELTFQYLALNHDRPLFKGPTAVGNIKLKQAIQYAVDRPALLRQLGAFAGKRATHYLPPGMPGYKQATLYPIKGSNYEAAKALAEGNLRGGTAVLYTCTRPACVNTSQILQFNLKQIGIDLEIQKFARAVQFEKEGVRGEPFDIAYEGWTADYADPFDFINILLDGTTIHEVNNNNFAYFNDPGYNRKMAQAAKLSGADRFARYGDLDIDLAKNASPIVAWSYRNNRLFFSKRVKNVVFNPVYGVSLTTLTVG
jgi:ABC-type oligopeptide transport system substrate-binding subunit